MHDFVSLFKRSSFTTMNFLSVNTNKHKRDLFKFQPDCRFKCKTDVTIERKFIEYLDYSDNGLGCYVAHLPAVFTYLYMRAPKQ